MSYRSQDSQSKVCLLVQLVLTPCPLCAQAIICLLEHGPLHRYPSFIFWPRQARDNYRHDCLCVHIHLPLLLNCSVLVF